MLPSTFYGEEQCIIFKVSDSCSLSLAQITHLGSDLSFALIMIIAPRTSRRWSHEATKNILNANKMTGIVNYVF